MDQRRIASGKILITVGVWRSPEAHLHGVQGVVGSNPITPTIKTFKFITSKYLDSAIKTMES